MATIRLLKGDCLQKLKELEDNSVDSIVTDPPYGLEFMGKEWDSFKTGRISKYKEGGKLDVEAIQSRKGKGGAGPSYTKRAAKKCRTCGKQEWSGSPCKCEIPNFEIDNSTQHTFQSFSEAWATECYRVLKPGGHLLAFAGSRMYHRLAVGVEDAGFEIRDQIMWIYGSGFPKSHNIGKAVDKLNGIEIEKGDKFNVVGGTNASNGGSKFRSDHPDYVKPEYQNDWNGWGTALKPAHEPIVMARKPFKGTVADNVLEWGTGGINVDGCRIGNEVRTTPIHSTDVKEDNTLFGLHPTIQHERVETTEGRFPANIIFDEEAGKILDEQSGIRKTGDIKPYISKDDGIFGTMKNKLHINSFKGDTGGASRFFYCPKASKKDRNSGLENKIKLNILWKNMAQEDLKVQLLVDTEYLAIKATEEFIAENKNDIGWNIELFGKLLMEQFQKDMTSTTKIKTNSITTSVIYNWLIGLLTKDWMEDVFLKKMDGTNLVENAESSNTKMTTIKVKKDGLNQSVKFVLGKELVEISLEESKSTHPTVKPTDLMAYLIRLVTPKGGVVLDPFMGSGSTGKAAVREGMNFIGIEREDEYMEIAKTRIEHEQKKNKHTEFFNI